MENPLVTIITTTYYRPDFLRKAILSVKKQTIQNYEHFIFSDHCPYAKKIINEFEDDKRITFYENKEKKIINDGAVGKKKGIELAKAEIICYCDDDNILLPNHLEIGLKHLNNNDCVFTQYYHIPVFTHEGGKYKSYFDWLKREITDVSGYDHIGNNDMLICFHKKNIVNNHSNWKTVGELKGRHNEDGTLICNWKKENVNIKYINIPTAIYFTHSGCIGGKGITKKYKKDYLNSLN